MSKEPHVLWLLGREIDIEALVRMKTPSFFPPCMFSKLSLIQEVTKYSVLKCLIFE